MSTILKVHKVPREVRESPVLMEAMVTLVLMVGLVILEELETKVKWVQLDFKGQREGQVNTKSKSCTEEYK